MNLLTDFVIKDTKPKKGKNSKKKVYRELSLKNGCTYEGDMKGKHFHGKGQLRYPDGSVYNG